ncbi:MAG TPA: family 78 glycoside hydrolase catalytic domain [Candidatus Eisenbergiella merdipullorum]|uniref:alpha-L-rhamnosidase n=1 Tax=Candidatus Eisenbergiella merdipullorum TaxID=2838553 RepID=A0A9D2L085_9FIRM|nr:family 78 glycoside hydrolase catalytic domain [Candidatus Eisenbergiella merdipullorum]
MNRKESCIMDAKWIGCPRISGHNSVLFRGDFSVKKKPGKAKLSVCCLGYGTVYINGKRVTQDVLTTPFTRFDQRVIYQIYDVDEFVSKGKNVIAVHLGNGWYNDVAETWDYEKAVWRHHPKMIASLELTWKDGEKDYIKTGSGWKAQEGPVTYNHIREGECVDARKVIKGWNEADFDDSLWLTADICRGPGGKLEQTNMPPERIIRRLEGRLLRNGIYDFGENISGWVCFTGRAPAGHETSLYFSERYQDGELDRKNICEFTLHELKHCDQYIFRGEGKEAFCPEFQYHGFRYVKVENPPGDFIIWAVEVHTDLKQVGDFSCSDKTLNQIHRMCVRSTLSNYHGIPTDCPHREQNGWTGDALLSSEQALLNFDMRDAYEKWMKDFIDVQRPNGQVPGIVPTSGWGYNWGSGPAWDSAMIHIPWYVYQNTQDISLLSLMWDAMEKYMSYMESMEEDGIVEYGLGDWCPPPGAVLCPTAVTDTAYYYRNACIMAQAAQVLGKEGERYGKLAVRIRKAFRKKFMSGDIREDKSQTSVACKIYQGLCDPEEIPAAAAHLAELLRHNNYHIDCGILGTKYIFSALSENGYAEELYRMVTNPEMPGYGYWVKQGMTTLCEHWQMKSSLNHHMFSEVDCWFYRFLGGIRISEKGVEICPVFLKELDFVNASHRDIQVFYDRKRLQVTVPCKAKVILNGNVFMVGPGRHEFVLD